MRDKKFENKDRNLEQTPNWRDKREEETGLGRSVSTSMNGAAKELRNSALFLGAHWRALRASRWAMICLGCYVVQVFGSTVCLSQPKQAREPTCGKTRNRKLTMVTAILQQLMANG